MKNIFLVALFIFLLFPVSSYAEDKSEKAGEEAPEINDPFETLFDKPKTNKTEKGNNYLDKINTDVQVQDNGWIKIVRHFVESQTMGELYRDIGAGDLLKTEKDKNKIVRHLYVYIQFLKYCKATIKQAEFKEDMSVDNLAKEFDNLLFDEDYEFHKFKCNYRNKVFVTFFTKEGYEIETKGNYPIAKKIDSSSDKRKTEMFPGEKTTVSFILIPDKATSWYPWVSK